MTGRNERFKKVVRLEELAMNLAKIVAKTCASARWPRADGPHPWRWVCPGGGHPVDQGRACSKRFEQGTLGYEMVVGAKGSHCIGAQHGVQPRHLAGEYFVEDVRALR